MRYPSCLTVAPLVMDATLGGSGGITPDPSLETGRRYIWYKEMAACKILLDPSPETVFYYTWVKEKNLKKCRLRFLKLHETRTSLEQAQVELFDAVFRL